jgi:selenocysteine lyase/cysteine desulfurase
VRQGGSGSESLRELPPEALPERFEAGNLNVPALAGVAAAAQFLLEHDVAELERRERPLSERLVAELDALPGVRVRGPRLGMPRAAVVSFGVEGYDPQEVAAILDASFDVQSRARLHCAPRMHGALGTLDQGGLVRFSPGWRTTPQDIDAAIAAVAALCDGSSLV